MLTEFNVEKFYLSKLCPKGHDWQGSSKSLRFKRDSKCVECKRDYIRKYHQQNRAEIKERRTSRAVENLALASEFDTQKFYLGSMCRQGHEHGNTSLSLRRLSTGACLECGKGLEKKWYEDNKQAVLQRHKDKYHGDHEASLARLAKQREANRESIRCRDLKYYAKKKQSGDLAWLLLRRKCEQNYRARKKSSHSSNYSEADLLQRITAFNSQCAYCGVLIAGRSTTIDHFIPLGRGGSHVLGNLIPACHRCNSSKSDSDPKDWYQRQKFFKPESWKFILKVLGKTESNYHQIPLL